MRQRRTELSARPPASAAVATKRMLEEELAEAYGLLQVGKETFAEHSLINH
jgi:hypothetical protein